MRFTPKAHLSGEELLFQLFGVDRRPLDLLREQLVLRVFADRALLSACKRSCYLRSIMASSVVSDP